MPATSKRRPIAIGRAPPLRPNSTAQIGEVVDAAIAGDFSRRVARSLADADLNALARLVNDLVETVDRGVGETGRVLAALADTDLTQRVEGQYQGAFDKLKPTPMRWPTSSTEIVGQLKRDLARPEDRDGRDTVGGQRPQSNAPPSRRRRSRRPSAAMEQLAHTVMENAKKAGVGQRAGQEGLQTAEEGGEVMTEANQAMERISASSAKISNIIGMIDDIAFQTNLLALNAFG